VEKRGPVEALRASGVKVRQAVPIVYRWAYLALAVEVRSGRLLWSWIGRLQAEAIAQVVSSWRAAGVEVVVWDGAHAHKAQQVGVRLICQPPYAPELNPVERVFEEPRRWGGPSGEAAGRRSGVGGAGGGSGACETIDGLAMDLACV